MLWLSKVFLNICILIFVFPLLLTNISYHYIAGWSSWHELLCTSGYHPYFYIPEKDKSYCNITVREKCLTISYLKLPFCFLFFQLLSKINKHKSRFNNLKEISTREFLCLHSIRGLWNWNWLRILNSWDDYPSMLYQRFIWIFLRNFAHTFLGHKAESRVSAWNS